MTSGDLNIALGEINDRNTFEQTRWVVSNAFYLVFLPLLVFELDGEHIPPIGAKLAETATGARIKNDLLPASTLAYAKIIH